MRQPLFISLVKVPGFENDVCVQKLDASAFLGDEKERAGEMTQPLRARTALPEVLSSNPSNHMVAHNHL